ncbi:flagellar hook protein FlgE [Sulfurimonas sp.]|uniref:flagellar hook protein FlgE n=1 Tax=Sulfurimonas sp. TaxID=2022749 RepID=UPI002605E72F|nr:flagellar hook-basal body complex protein [Sulfurimonas sp.]
MTQAFYTGINGIQTHQYGIDVIADNLSNISTVGFRSYNTEFSSLFEETLNTSSGLSSVDSGVGVGAMLSTVSMNEDRGSFMLTDRSTDLAILGDGWFGIQSNGKSIYTRDGAFTFDANRDLVTNDGYYVLGTMGSNITDGVLTEQLAEVGLGEASAQEKLRFPEDLLFPVQPTTEVKFYGNLSVENTTRVISAKAIDAQGDKNNIRLEFTQVDPQVLPGIQWNVVATAQSLDGETIYDTQTGVIKFDEAGALISNTLSSIDNNGAAVSINVGSGYDGITSISGKFYASSSSNGIEAGELAGYDINRNGEIVATFTNGMQSSVGTIAVYHFANDRGLEKVSGTRFAESSNSGKAIFFKDAQGKNIIGTDITNYKLEGSNVKIEVALSEMIIMQRAYDANSKSITTADEMMQKALSMDAS